MAKLNAPNRRDTSDMRPPKFLRAVGILALIAFGVTNAIFVLHWCQLVGSGDRRNWLTWGLMWVAVCATGMVLAVIYCGLTVYGKTGHLKIGFRLTLAMSSAIAIGAAGAAVMFFLDLCWTFMQ